MPKHRSPTNVYGINSYLNTLPNMTKLSGTQFQQFVKNVFDADQMSYHSLRQGLPDEGDVVVWNEFYECTETCGRQKYKIRFDKDVLPNDKDCAISSIVVLDVYDDDFINKPFSKVKEGGLHRNYVKVKVRSRPLMGFAVRIVITAKVFRKTS